MFRKGIMSAAVFAVISAFLAQGCATERVVFDAAHPEIAMTETGTVLYRGRVTDPEDLPGLLRSSGMTRRDTVYIGIPDRMRDWRSAHRVMAIIARGGFPRPVLVAPRHSTSEVSNGREKRRGAKAH